MQSKKEEEKPITSSQSAILETLEIEATKPKETKRNLPLTSALPIIKNLLETTNRKDSLTQFKSEDLLKLLTSGDYPSILELFLHSRDDVLEEKQLNNLLLITAKKTILNEAKQSGHKKAKKEIKKETVNITMKEHFFYRINNFAAQMNPETHDYKKLIVVIKEIVQTYPQIIKNKKTNSGYINLETCEANAKKYDITETAAYFGNIALLKTYKELGLIDTGKVFQLFIIAAQQNQPKVLKFLTKECGFDLNEKIDINEYALKPTELYPISAAVFNNAHPHFINHLIGLNVKVMKPLAHLNEDERNTYIAFFKKTKLNFPKLFQDQINLAKAHLKFLEDSFNKLPQNLRVYDTSEIATPPLENSLGDELDSSHSNISTSSSSSSSSDFGNPSNFHRTTLKRNRDEEEQSQSLTFGHSDEG